MISRIPTASRHRLRRGLPGYLILFAPTLSHLSVSISPGGRLRHWCSFYIYAFHPLHRKFHHPLPYSGSVVLDAVPRLSLGFHIQLAEPPTRALRPVIPINACTLRITAAAGTKLAGAYSVGNVKQQGINLLPFLPT